MDSMEWDRAKDNKIVMVVDDEEMILKVTCIIISKMGLRPLAFSQSRKALDYYRLHYREIDLVLLDMVMPDINGRELFERMKKINPSVLAILLSGWIEENEGETDFQALGLMEFLRKPVEKSILEEAVQRVLA